MNKEYQETKNQRTIFTHGFCRIPLSPILQKRDNRADKIWQAEIVQIMKTKLCLLIFLLAAALLRAQTNDLTALLQQGLFEEQASRNLDAAIADYSALAKQFDKDRQLAATAVFRLGECYRAQGRTNEAAAQYQRILHDFSDQQTLATLSRQDLAGMGMASQALLPATPTESAGQATELEAETASLKAQIEHLSGLNREGRRIAIQQNFPNAVLTKLMQDLNDAQQKLAGLTNDYAPQSTQIINATALVNAINGQIDTQVDGAIKGLQTKLEADLNTAKTLRAQAGSVPSSRPAVVNDEEEQEIRRIQTMIQNSPDLINAPSGEDQFTPLCRAAGKDQLRVATFLLDNGADVNLKDKNHRMTPLHYAADGGHKRMVDLLISRGADVNAKDGSDKTALYLAMERNFPAVAETLLTAKADVNASNDRGITPLMLAAQNGDRKLAAAMLALGANPNLQNNTRQGWSSESRERYGTALHLAAARNDAAMVALLLTHHADVKLRSIAGCTPLDVAALMGATEVASQLISAGADVNAAGPANTTGGATPLLLATGNDHTDTVKLLLEHGANPDAAYTTGAGSTPLMLAANSGNSEIARLLLEHGARTDLGDNEHKTALYRAVDRGNVKVVQLLLAHGANPNERTSQNYPLLIIATAGNKPDLDIVAALLKAKADVNAADSSGQTALYYAVRDSRMDLAEMLLAAGADPNLRTKEGQTPLDLVKEQSSPPRPPGFRPTSGEAPVLATKSAGPARQSGRTAPPERRAGQFAELGPHHRESALGQLFTNSFSKGNQ